MDRQLVFSISVRELPLLFVSHERTSIAIGVHCINERINQFLFGTIKKPVIELGIQNRVRSVEGDEVTLRTVAQMSLYCCLNAIK